MKFKKLLKYLFFLFLMTGLCFLYSFSSEKNQQKKISEIEVGFKEEHIFLTHSMIYELLEKNNSAIKDQAKSTIDLYDLERQITNNVYVEKASVFLTIEGVLKSMIKQRKPMARIIAKNNSYYIDNQGVKIPLSKNYSARVPLVYGVEDGKNLKGIVFLMSIISRDRFLNKEIIAIQKLDTNEYQFSVRSGNYIIDFGKIENAHLKFEKLKGFYNKVFLDKTIKDYKRINVKYHAQVVCTKWIKDGE